MRKIINLLAFRLFCLLLIVSAVVFISLTSIIIRANEEHVMQQIILSAKRTNALILRSMHQSMLLNRLEDVAQTIDSLGNEPGVEGIRIYNKTGAVVFSTNHREIGQTADLKAEQCIVCHSGREPLEHIPETAGSRILTSSNGYRILGVVSPIHNEPSCSAPACHPSPGRQTFLGMLDSQFNLAQLDKDIISRRNLMIVYSIGAILLIALFAGLLIRQIVHTRVVKLAEGHREVKKGNLDFSIQVEGKDELAELARSFNSMVANLKHAYLQLARTEKLTALGKMAAGVAHGINNPLGGILLYSNLIFEDLPEGSHAYENARKIIEQTNRCKEIVQNLLDFSRIPAGEMAPVEINNVVSTSLNLVKDQWMFHGIEIETRLAETLPDVIGNTARLEEVFLNLFINAADAMKGKGRLTITTGLDSNNSIKILVSDTGEGIKEEHLPHIFEPFFTTKDPGKGTGLGLSMAYGTIRKHGGLIDVESVVEKGTTFIISLPAQMDKYKGDDDDSNSNRNLQN
ncbi:MAG TPA: ATP-binding protein [Syntrophobacteraceae bacterium]|nr:ATP-binding protein [Syntrophobacteraceae bacterium]